MTLLLICTALLIGVVIGATELTVIVNAVDRAAGELHALIAELEKKLDR